MRNNCRVVLTDRCNLDCDFCCMKDRKISDSFMSCSPLQIAGLCYDEIAITGGEPLLEFEKLVQFICMTKYFNKDAKVYLYTNGMSLNYYEAFALKTAGLTGINWSPKEKPNLYYQEKMNFINSCLVPVRMLIQDKLMDDNILQFSLNTGIQIKQWTIGDCDDMEPEDRYRIDWSQV